MTDAMCVALCKEKKKNPKMTQHDAIKWVHNEYGIKVTQGTISNTLKRSAELLQRDIDDSNMEVKRHRLTKYTQVEQALYEWFITYQEQISMSGNLLKEKATYFLAQLYPDAESFQSQMVGLKGSKTAME